MPIAVYIVCGCRHGTMAKLRNNGRDPLLTNQNVHSFPTSCFHFRVGALCVNSNHDQLKLKFISLRTMSFCLRTCDSPTCLHPIHSAGSRATSADSSIALAGTQHSATPDALLGLSQGLGLVAWGEYFMALALVFQVSFSASCLELSSLLNPPSED